MKEWLIGRNPVYEVLAARRRQVFRLWVAKGAEDKGRLHEIINLAQARHIPIEPVQRQQLDSISDSHQGVALEASAYPYAAIQDILKTAQDRHEALFVLVLDTIQNPQNLGTLIRTGEAAGIHGILLPLARSAGITPAVVSASAGACEHLLVATANLAQGLETFKRAGAWVIGLDESPQSQPVDQVRLDGALVLVVGSEGEGMRNLVRRSCDVLARLPMYGKIESLNAAVAGSIVLYMALNQRKGEKTDPKS